MRWQDQPDYLLPPDLRRPRWLNEDQALRYVQRGASTLRRWRYAGEVKAHRTSKGWLYDRESLAACEVEMVRRYEERACPGFKGR
ncbi:hypothetical protein RHDE110596_22535 [Prescottella defluvii]